MKLDLDLLEGATDLHLHAGPSVFPRLMDAVETAKAARASCMRGVVIKHHHTPTVDRGYFVHKAVPEIEVYGGVTLNYAAGGLNPFAVDSALRLGGKIVWMPSVDAQNHKTHFGELGKIRITPRLRKAQHLQRRPRHHDPRRQETKARDRPDPGHRSRSRRSRSHVPPGPERVQSLGAGGE